MVAGSTSPLARTTSTPEAPATAASLVTTSPVEVATNPSETLAGVGAAEPCSRITWTTDGATAATTELSEVTWLEPPPPPGLTTGALGVDDSCR